MEAEHVMENNQNKKAIALHESFIPPANEEEKYTIAELYMQWGFLKEASAILTELLRMYPDENDIKVMLADIYIELEKDEKAIELLYDVNKADPAYIQTLIQLAD